MYEILSKTKKDGILSVKVKILAGDPGASRVDSHRLFLDLETDETVPKLGYHEKVTHYSSVEEKTVVFTFVLLEDAKEGIDDSRPRTKKGSRKLLSTESVD